MFTHKVDFFGPCLATHVNARKELSLNEREVKRGPTLTLTSAFSCIAFTHVTHVKITRHWKSSHGKKLFVSSLAQTRKINIVSGVTSFVCMEQNVLIFVLPSFPFL